MGSGVAAALASVAVAGLAAAVVVAPSPASPPPTPPAGATTAVGAWTWPVDPHRVVRTFDDVGRYAAGHRGVDLAAAPGTTVVAVADGEVTFAGPVAGRGVVVVAHPDGLRTTYEPLDASVRPGQPVVVGAPLGTVATQPVHCASSCLHLGLRAGETYLDPLSRLRGAPPVLLPLGRP
ncbi:M23 family metallopeptidase [Kineococcus sp. NPDC059986]|jgi:murein DD-endopeptidase MepM/ murein hydrolase activator NlpD|uniref:murein hydrolase activator EnvC family protein n=1 Tax=Kineococcus sp. NPDC059986 TaxID=3155538 RepID=UPI00344F966B